MAQTMNQTWCNSIIALNYEIYDHDHKFGMNYG